MKSILRTQHVLGLSLFTVFTSAAYSLMAGYYLNHARYTGVLSIGARFLSEREGRAVASTNAPNLEPWRVDISHVFSKASSSYLAYPLEGDEAFVRFADKQSDEADWEIEIVQRLAPAKWGVGQGKSAPGNVGPLVEGKEGIAFRLSARNGRFKGWYLAENRTEDVKDAKTALPLILVSDKAKAATLVYEERFHRPVDRKEARTP